MNSDCISKRDIIRKLNSNKDFLCSLHKDFVLSHSIKIRVETIKDCIKEIESAKPIEINQKIGYWRPIYQGDEIIDYRCTNCENGSTFGKSPVGMNYCPSCGSKNTVLK